MARRPALAILCVMIAAVLIGATCGLGSPGPAGAATRNAIHITAPTGAYPPNAYDDGQEIAISWTLDAAVRSGLFCTCIINDEGQAMQSQAWPATGGSLYGVQMKLDVPGGDIYHVSVHYHAGATTSSRVTLRATGAATFLVNYVAPPPPDHLMTATWGVQRAIRCAPVDFPFVIFNATETPGIATGSIVVDNAKTGVVVATITLPDEFPWKISTTWDVPEPTMTYRWTQNDLAVGTYHWHVDVTTEAGVPSEDAMEGELTIARR